MRFLLLSFVFSLISGISFCQKIDSLSFKANERSAKPFDVRPAFLHFSMRSLPAINEFQTGDRGSNSDFDINKSYRIKLNVPVYLGKKLNVFGQFRYHNEQLHLGEDILENEKEIHFDNAGMSIMFRYKLNNSYFLGGHVGGFFKSDQLSLAMYSSILDYSGSIIVGKEVDKGSIGFGAIMGNSLGRFRLYPMILIDYRLSERWNLEMKLPKEIQFRKMLKPDSFYFIGGAEVNAASYFISESIFDDNMDVEFRRAAVDLRIGIEKEIYDFLWFGLEAGFTQPVYSALVSSGQPTRNKLFDFNQSFTPYGSFSIYLVPPRSLFNKLRSK